MKPKIPREIDFWVLVVIFVVFWAMLVITIFSIFCRTKAIQWQKENEVKSELQFLKNEW